jgi:hypothetical protein
MLKPLPPSIHSLADLFEFSCRQKPQELAYAFVRETLELESQLTYGEFEFRCFFLIGQRRITCGTARLHQG